MVPHSATKKTPFDLVFGKLSTKLRHTWPLVCRVEFRPPVKNIGTFDSPAESGINLFYKGGGAYQIDAESGAVRTKHLNFIDEVFAGSASQSDSNSDSTETSDTESSSGQSKNYVSTWQESKSDGDNLESNTENDDSDDYSSEDETKSSENEVESKD